MNRQHAASEIFALAFVALAFFTLKAHGHEVEEDTGVICDTQQQIERYVRLGQSPQAVTIINEGTHACALVNVRFIRGGEVNRVYAGDKAMQVVEILLVQANVQGVWTTIDPAIQYALFNVEEKKA